MKPPTVTCPARTYGKASTLIPLSSVRSMPPTRWRSSSCDGEGMGMGIVGTENKKSYLAAVLYPRRFRSGTSL